MSEKSKPKVITEIAGDPDQIAPPTPEMEAVVREERHFLARVYGLAACGLFLSALVAYWTLHRPDMFEYVHEHQTSFQVLFLFEVISVAVISNFVGKMSIGIASLTFVGYAIFNGLSFCVFFLLLPPGSIAFGFLISALTFTAVSAYGLYFPDGDLRGIGGMLKTLLIGLALVVSVNLLGGNSMVYWATSYLGVIIFASLAAYHSDFICDLEYEFEDDDSARDKATVIGALVIYLDFVNLYLLVMNSIALLASKAEEEE